MACQTIVVEDKSDHKVCCVALLESTSKCGLLSRSRGKEGQGDTTKKRIEVEGEDKRTSEKRA